MLVRMLLWHSFVANASVSGEPGPCLIALMESVELVDLLPVGFLSQVTLLWA